MRAPVLLCVLASLCLSSGGRMTSIAKAESAALDRATLLSHLTLTDLAVCRLDKRLPSFESKSHRRLSPVAPPRSSISVALSDRYDRWLSASDAARCRSSVFISPESGRAPPAL